MLSFRNPAVPRSAASLAQDRSRNLNEEAHNRQQEKDEEEVMVVEDGDDIQMQHQVNDHL